MTRRSTTWSRSLPRPTSAGPGAGFTAEHEGSLVRVALDSSCSRATVTILTCAPSTSISATRTTRAPRYVRPGGGRRAGLRLPAAGRSLRRGARSYSGPTVGTSFRSHRPHSQGQARWRDRRTPPAAERPRRSRERPAPAPPATIRSGRLEHDGVRTDHVTAPRRSARRARRRRSAEARRPRRSRPGGEDDQGRRRAEWAERDRQLPLGNGPTVGKLLCLDVAGADWVTKALWVPCIDSGVIVVIDPTTAKVVRTMPGGPSPIVVLPAAGHVWVSHTTGNAVWRL